MNALNRSLTLLMTVSALIACTSLPPAATPRPSETATPAQPAITQSGEQAPSATAALPQPPTVATGHLSPALEMSTGRAAHTATLLPDGSVLIAGGFRQVGTSEVAIASAEIYDPRTNRFTPTGDMNVARIGHAATLLPNGQVLIVGGWGESNLTSTAELYDPQTGKFSKTASSVCAQGGHDRNLAREWSSVDRRRRVGPQHASVDRRDL